MITEKELSRIETTKKWDGINIDKFVTEIRRLQSIVDTLSNEKFYFKLKRVYKGVEEYDTCSIAKIIRFAKESK